jgi:hypothetical protein
MIMTNAITMRTTSDEIEVVAAVAVEAEDGIAIWGANTLRKRRAAAWIHSLELEAERWLETWFSLAWELLVEHCWEVLEGTNMARARAGINHTTTDRLVGDIGGTVTKMMRITGGGSISGRCETAYGERIRFMMTYDFAALAALTILICIS